LTIGDCKGSFPGKLKERKFNIVLVDKNKGKGTFIPEKYDNVVLYNGRKVVIKL
jgi:alpha-D-xyloside xylohydrolase